MDILLLYNIINDKDMKILPINDKEIPFGLKKCKRNLSKQKRFLKGTFQKEIICYNVKCKCRDEREVKCDEKIPFEVGPCAGSSSC